MKKVIALLSICTSGMLFSQVDHSTHWNAKEYHFNSEEQFQVARSIVESLALRGDEAVLDIGCGDGKITAMIQAKASEGQTMGIDISTSMVSYARAMFPHIKFEQKDAHLIDFDNQFDLVVSFTAMQWVTDQRQALQGIYKALKSSGKTIIEMPQGLPTPFQAAVDKVKNDAKWREYFVNYSPNWRFYECNEYRSLLEEANFTIESINSREITHEFPSRQAIIGFLRQWFPYLSQIPSDSEKSVFLEQVVDEYMKNLNLSSQEVPFKVRRLNVVATVTKE